MIAIWSLISLLALRWTWYPSAIIGMGMFGAALLIILGLKRGDGPSFILFSIVISTVTWTILFLVEGNDIALWTMTIITLLLSGWASVRHRRKISFGAEWPTPSVRSVAFLILVIMVFYVAWSAYQPYDGDDLTEFYLLNIDGEASDYPDTIVASEDVGVLLCLNNHEGRKVAYEVQIWLTDRSNSSNILDITTMNYQGSINVILEDQPYPPMEKWKAQYLEVYVFSIDTPGTYKMWFILFIDTVPLDLQGLTKGSDYLALGQDLLGEILEGQRLALSLNLEVIS